MERAAHASQHLYGGELSLPDHRNTGGPGQFTKLGQEETPSVEDEDLTVRRECLKVNIVGNREVLAPDYKNIKFSFSRYIVPRMLSDDVRSNAYLFFIVYPPPTATPTPYPLYILHVTLSNL